MNAGSSTSWDAPLAVLGANASKDTLMLAFIALGVLAIALLVLVIALWIRLRRQKTTADSGASAVDSGNQSAPTAPVEVETRQGYLEEVDEGIQHELIGNPYRIGRHSSNHLPIIDRSVSRQHAEIHRDERGQYAITDMDSMNGVFVNNRQLKRSVLSDGDLVELGDISFTFKLLEPRDDQHGSTVMLNRSEPDLFLDDEPLDFDADLFDDFDDNIDERSR